MRSEIPISPWIARLARFGWWVALSACSQHAAIGEVQDKPPPLAGPDAGSVVLHGLKGEYFKSVDWSGTPVAVRIDPLLNLTWEFGMPFPGVDEAFSARWTGEVEVPFDDTYTISVNCDDTCQVLFDHKIVIDRGGEMASSVVSLTAGRRPIEARMSSAAGFANIRVSWSSLLQSRELIPSARFYPAR